MAGMFQITGSVAATTGDNNPAVDNEHDTKQDTQNEKFVKKFNSDEKIVNDPRPGSVSSKQSTITSKRSSSTTFNLKTVRESTEETAAEEHNSADLQNYNRVGNMEGKRKVRKIGRIENHGINDQSTVQNIL
jgi:hypothetical protein